MIMVPDGYKRCSDCQTDKPVSEYRRNQRRPDGLSFYCRDCFKSRDAAGYRRRRKRLGFEVRPRESLPEGLRRCSACREVKDNADFPKNRALPSGYLTYCKLCHAARSRRDYFRRQYGLSDQDVAALIDSQSGLCAICQSAPAAHVDHNHITGKIRGALCFPCNGGLGQFKDRSDILQRAITYLEEHPWRTLVEPGVYRLHS